jgi:hypothetical protein
MAQGTNKGKHLGTIIINPPVNTGGGGGGTFTPTFQAIDGGPTYYNDNSFTFAVNAGFDGSTFIESGMWPSQVTASSDVTLMQDLNINSMQQINGGSNFALLAGAGIYAWPGIYGEPPTLVNQAGAETVGFNLCDETRVWNDATQKDVVTVAAGTNSATCALNTATLKTTVCVGRALWINFDDTLLAASYAPTANVPASLHYTSIADPGGHTRKVDLGSFDLYWMSGSSDPLIFCSTVGDFSQIYGLGGTSFTSNPAPGSISIPTVFPTDISFTTTPGLGVQLGTACVIQRGGAGSYAGIIGTVTKYVSSSGLTTIHVVDGHTYTVSWGANGGGGGWVGGFQQFQVGAVDAFIWFGTAQNTLGANPKITDVTTPANIPAGTELRGQGGQFGLTQTGVAGWNLFTSANTTIATNDVIKVASTVTQVGNGPFNDFSAHFAIATDQARRGARYGDMIDAQRGFHQNTGSNSPTRTPSPILTYIEPTGDYYSSGATNQYVEYPTPQEINQATWCAIMHGCRRPSWFTSTFGGNQNTGAGNNCFYNSYFSTIQSGNNNYFGVPNTVSIYDQAKTTRAFVKALAPVLNSQFVTNYVTVSPNGFQAPFPASFNQNDGISIATSGFYNTDLAVLDGVNQISFEVMAKYYTGSTTGIFVNNKYWIFSAYRGSALDTNKTATFTIGNTGAATVTRFYMDTVVAVASSNAGATTRISVADTSQMVALDPVTITGTSGIAGLNGTFTIQNPIVSGTQIDINLAWPGGTLGGSSPPPGHGQILSSHTIPVTGFTSFSDVFTQGTDIRIYRVN